MRFFRLLPLVLASACVRAPPGVWGEVRAHASAAISCPAAAIWITERPGEHGAPPAEWTAHGCGREAGCEYIDQVGNLWCAETPASKQRTEDAIAARRRAEDELQEEIHQAAVKDRLVVDTGCPGRKVRFLRAAEWSRAAEHAYRLEACGRQYVCSSNMRGIDCKVALAESPSE